jgi:hypothetical protein
VQRTSVVPIIAAIGAVVFLVFGIWPFFGPRSFYDALAEFPPYNPHFLHDIGAFQIGLGATLALALWRRQDALLAALGGAGIGAAFHAVAHIRDHDLGGSDGDWVAHAVLAALLLGGAAWRLAPERK